MVRPAWREVLSHSTDGTMTGGDIDDLADSFAHGAEVKVAIRGLCDDLTPAEIASAEKTHIDHEVFIHLGACYYYTT